MHRRQASLAAAALALAGVLHHENAVASSLPTAPHRASGAFTPVVVEWFGVVHPRAGQRDVVHVQLLNNNKPFRGARLTATLFLGNKPLVTMQGGTTDVRGKADLPFTVPSSAGGKTLRVRVTLAYRTYRFTGRNDLRVAR